MEEFEAVGMERDLAGLPVVKLPAQFLRAKPGSNQRKVVDDMRKMVKTIRRNEHDGIVFPNAYDQDTKQPLYTLELLGGGGGRQFNTDGIIQRYEQRILMSVLADFIMVGHQNVGSYSLHTDKTGIFRNSMNAIAQTIADTLNRQAVPKLLMANGMKPDEMPKIKPNDVDAPDITQLAAFMQSMASMGMQWFPDAEMEKFVRDTARLPEMDKDAEDVEREMGDMQTQIRFAQKQAEWVQAQAAQQQAEVDPMGSLQNEQQGNQQGGSSNGQQQKSQQSNQQGSQSWQ